MATDETGVEEIDRQWWKEAVVYQIYPRSFKDSDGDGVGDIPGIIEKVDYIDSLGVDVVWLCPVYDSPNADNGYDIRDYRSIMDAMGTMDDWETLLAELHDRDIKLIMDLVVNHTSDEHEWFQKSRRREGKYEDYYIWKDGDPEEPPNNWTSSFGGPAWSYDEKRGQWYLHLFDEKQPDLNWENPAVRADIKDMLEWWLEKGIDGFRMDVINFISKDQAFPDGSTEYDMVGAEYFVDGPRVHEFISELYEDVFDRYDVITVGEMPFVDVEEAPKYVGEDGDGMHMAFHFDHATLDFGETGRWSVRDPDLTDIKAVFSRWQTTLAESNAWNAVYWENHDQPRSISRYANDDQYRRESATLLATFLMTLRGTPFVYQGEELGMTNADFESLEDVRDVDTRNPIETMLETGEIESYEEIRDIVNHRSRDHARTPMQWSSEDNAGFTDGEPWINVNDNYTEINVADQREDEHSVLQYYRDLIVLRHSEDVLVYGEYDLVLPEDEQIYAYTRTLGDEQALVVLNWSEDARALDLREHARERTPDVTIANYYEVGSDLADLNLRPYEARVYRLV
ncbi:MAG: glycoside hydrolase family 13 protein [Halorhabdus sp.]